MSQLANGPIEELAARLENGNRRALAKAITLVENHRSDQRKRANQLVSKILPKTGNAIRIGISGVPGVGKSTFIEALGMYLTGMGKKVAVLAVDPSSKISGGSIMGDKVRMERLSRDPNAFIRPSPSAGSLGAWPAEPGRPCCFVKRQVSTLFLLKPLAWDNQKLRFAK